MHILENPQGAHAFPSRIIHTLLSMLAMTKVHVMTISTMQYMYIMYIPS